MLVETPHSSHGHRPIAVVPRPLKRDGEVARTLLNKYVDEVLAPIERPIYTKVTVPEDCFDVQLKKLEDEHVPLISQTARKAAVWPVHTSEQRKRCIDVCNRIKRNEGTMISCRLSSELMDDELVERLSFALRENTCLEKLMLHDNSITDKGILPLCRALRRHPCLNSLWLGSNQLSDACVEYLASLVEKNHAVKDINLSNKWPKPRWMDTEKLDHPHITAMGARRFASALSSCCGLTSLSLHDQRVRDEGAIALFEALPNSNLVVLNVGSNEITDGACTALSACLSATYCPLRELFLEKNSITDKGAVLISNGITNNSGLFTLDLNTNLIGEAGIEALFEALLINRGLEAVMVRHNRYSGEVIDSLLSEKKIEREQALADQQGRYTPGSRYSWMRASGTPDRVLSKYRKARDTKQLDKINENNRRFNQIRSEFGGRLLSPSSWSKYRESHSPARKPNMMDIVRSAKGASDKTKAADGPSDSVLPSPSKPGTAFPVTPVRGTLTAESDFAVLSKDDVNSLTGAPPTPILPSRMSTPGVGFVGPATRPGPAPRDSSPSGSSVGSRDSADRTSYHNAIMTRGKSRTNLFSPNEASKNRINKILGANRADASRTSEEIGKTLGVPNLKGLIGKTPVRSAISRHGDSGINLIHLRVSTPADPPNAAPVSLIKIDMDRKNERARVVESRQNLAYKEEKFLTIYYGNKSKLQAATGLQPPDKFWKEWKEKVRIMHPKGIDVSVASKKEELRLKQEQAEWEFEESIRRQDPEYVKKHPKSVRSPVKKGNNSPVVWGDSPSGAGNITPTPIKNAKPTNPNTSKAEKSMLELLAVEHVFRSNKNSINPADVEYLRKRAIDPVLEHIDPTAKKSKGADAEKLASPNKKVDHTSQYKGISYPAMIGLSDVTHQGAGGAVVDKRKLTSSVI